MSADANKEMEKYVNFSLVEKEEKGNEKVERVIESRKRASSRMPRSVFLKKPPVWMLLTMIQQK